MEKDKELLQAYEDLVAHSNTLIDMQRKRIADLESELTDKNETIEKLFKLIDESLSITEKTVEAKNILLTPSLN